MTGHLFCKRAALALMALFAALAMTLLPADGGKVSHAQTPTTVTLVSNTGQSLDSGRSISGERHYQRFTTGSHQHGYTITGIRIIMRSSPAGPTSVAMTLHSGSETGTKVADFTGPSSLTDEQMTYTFTPTAALSLGASTRYWIVLNQTANIRVAQTLEDSEDAGSAEGWRIQNRAFYSTMIGVDGYENLPPPPTSTDSAVETVVDTAHTFTAANFNFMPATTEDTLTKVHIVTLPDEGTLALSGTAVTAGQEITKADIDAGNLKFTPVADEFGDPYTSFLFRVEGSSQTSTATYTMTIDVTAVTTIFVSNTGQGSQEGVFVNTRRAQSFTTGYNSTGYIFSEVQLISTDPEGDPFAMQICQTDSAEGPVLPCTALTPPDSFAAGTLAFTAPVGHTLDANTTYSFTMRTPGDTGNVTMSGTTSTAEDASSLAGWSIRDMFHARPSNVWSSISSDKSFRIAIEGIAKSGVAGAPTSTDNTVETVVDTAHTFSAAHFNFMATTSGDALSKVHILTLPDEGTLALSGVEVTAGDEISKTDIDAGNLKFTPDTGETGQGYASFDSRVEGSSHKSTNGYRMTIDVRTEHDSVPPALAATDPPVLAADGKTLTLTYDEPMKETSTPANDAFTVDATAAGGSEAEVELAATNGVSVSGSTVVLKLDNPIAHNDGSVKVTYDKPGSGAVIEDANGNDAPGFTDQAVTNNSLIPRVSIEALFADASPAIADPKFKFTRSNTGVGTLRVALEMSQTGAHLGTFVSRPSIPASDTEVDANVVTFDLDAANTINTNGMMTLTVIGGDDHLPALAPNNSATVELRVPASGPTVRIEFQEDSYTIDEGIGNLVLEVVSIIAPGVAAPRHERGLRAAVLTEVISGPGTMLPLEEDSATINVDYSHIAVNTTPINVNDWTCIQDEGCTYTENVNVPILEDDKHERDEKFRYYLDSTPGITSLYYFDTTKRIATILDNDPLGVTNVTVSSTPTGGYYDATDSIEFTVTFNGSVTVTGTPRLSFDQGGQTRRANYASGSGSDELVFSYTVTASDADDHDGISWDANALRLNGGTIKFTSADVNSRVDADLAHPARGPLPDHKVLTENALPTASNSAVRTYANTDYTFAARDFKFADTDMDDALVSVKVVTLPASGKGTLKLNNTAIVETALPKTVTETELGQNKLVYSPPPMDMIGEDFASFTFRVSDGDGDSSDTYTMTVYVLPPSTTLVSNLSTDNDGGRRNGSDPIQQINFEHATSFTTGMNDRGYGLTSVTLEIKTQLDRNNRQTPVPDFAIHSDSNGSPGEWLFDLDNPSNSIGTSYAEFTFNAPLETRLAPDTTYWLVVYSYRNVVDTGSSDTFTEDPKEQGWSIGDTFLWRTKNSNAAWSRNNARTLQMGLEGVVLTPTRAEPSNSDFPYSDQTWGFVDTSVSSIGRMDATLDSGRRTGDWWKLRLEPHRRYRVEVEFGSSSNQARGGGIDVNYDAALWDHNRDDGRAFIEFYASPESYHLRVRARDFLNDDSMPFYGRYAVSLIDITNITRKVSNTRAYSGEKTEVSNTLWKASSFTTGSNTGGYKLSYVGTGLHNKTGANSVRAELWTHSGGDVPGTKIFDFLRAGKITGHPTAYRTDRFWAPPNAANLVANTKYWVVFKDMNSGSTYEVTVVSTGNENPGAASGWSIGDPTMNYAPAATTPVWFTLLVNSPILLEIFAENVVPPPTMNASEAVDQAAPQLRERPQKGSATVDGSTLTLAYDEPLDVTATPPLSAFTVNIGGSPRPVIAVAVGQRGSFRRQ